MAHGNGNNTFPNSMTAIGTPTYLVITGCALYKIIVQVTQGKKREEKKETISPGRD